MANEFYTAEQVASVALRLAADSMSLASVVTRAFEGDFQPGGGNTVVLATPGALIARDRALDDKTTQIVLDELQESSVTVSLDTHAYSGVSLSEQDLSLDLADFARQVLRPQVDAVVDTIEHKIAAELSGVAEDTTIAFDPANPVPTFTRLRRALRSLGTDTAAQEIVAVVGSNVMDALLDADAFTPAASGTDETLRSAEVGKVRGFTVLESGRVDADRVVAFARDAVALTVKAPVVPQGAAFGQVVRDRNLSLRYLRDYDTMTTRDRSLVSTFVGVTQLPTVKVARDYDTGVVTVTQAPAQVVAVDTATAPV